MDESGLTYFWGGASMQSWQDQVIAQVVDNVRSQRYDDRMNDAANELEPPKPTPAEFRNARREIRTDPDVRERVEEIAEKIRAMLFDGDDILEDFTEEQAENHFPSLREAHVWADEDVSPEEFQRRSDVAMSMMCDLQNFVWGEMLAMLKPLVIRVVNTGDWKESD
jgi:hypothetical protein